MKKAFTLIELVFVIVIIGVIASITISSSRTNPLQEAAIQVLSDIKYTQHLAMVNDTYDNNNLWFRSRWQIVFRADSNGNQNVIYEIFSDLDKNNNNNGAANEIAVNPSSRLRMSGDSMHLNARTREMDLTAKYGIIGPANGMMNEGCANNQRIFFDFLGRPHVNNNTAYGNLLQAQCTLTLTDVNNNNITIRIEQETGYACILNALGNCM